MTAAVAVLKATVKLKMKSFKCDCDHSEDSFYCYFSRQFFFFSPSRHSFTATLVGIFPFVAKVQNPRKPCRDDRKGQSAT